MTDTDTIQTVRRIDGQITAASPVHTGGDEKTGNQTLLRRQTMLDPSSGDRREIPIVAGNTVRGHLRRLVVKDLIDRLDYTFSDEDVYYALYSGGRLEKGSGGGRFDKSLRRRVRDNIPPLSLFGTALGNQMFAGVVDVGHMLPLCEELSDRLDAESELRAAELTDFEFHTRSDDDPDDEGFDIGFEITDERGEDETARQMKYEFEVFVPGVQFRHQFTLHSHASPLDATCLAHAIDLWTTEATIGGMAASGYGKLEVEYDHDIDTRPYLDHVEDEADAIAETLSELASLT